jgi:DNA-binding transcriptional ArsR family regulator
MTPTRLLWDLGTAYDLFVSVQVLHTPSEFGVRGAWAAGVRARVPADEREALERVQSMVEVPLHWIYTLPEPRDAETALWALEQLAPMDRLLAICLRQDRAPDGAEAILREVARRGSWTEEDREALHSTHQDLLSCMDAKEPPSARKLEQILDWWGDAEQFGERYLAALRAYHEVFFAEEERRIRPALRAALSRAQEQADQMPLLDLLEELSQGLRFDERETAHELVLAPSYWCTPLMYFGMVSPERELLLFGARSAEDSLVPGEFVPDALVRSLKALSDPTRLRILHSLTREPRTPAQLARQLRLRAPTVIHHLKALRLAGLVQLQLGEEKQYRDYAARPDMVKATCDALRDFLGESSEDAE